MCGKKWGLLFSAFFTAQLFAGSCPEFLMTTCSKCHGPEKQKGDHRFDSLTAAITTADDALLWQEILDQLNQGEMPPHKGKQPPKPELLPAVDAITSSVGEAAERFKATAPHSVLRRLNSYEYPQTIGDLPTGELNPSPLRIQFPSSAPTKTSFGRGSKKQLSRPTNDLQKLFHGSARGWVVGERSTPSWPPSATGVSPVRRMGDTLVAPRGRSVNLHQRVSPVRRMGDTLVAPAAWAPPHQNKFWPRREETVFFSHQRLTEAVSWESRVQLGAQATEPKLERAYDAR